MLVPQDNACCGLTWISTGQLDGAKKQLTHLLGVLGPFAVNGIPIVGLEPSCTAVLRSDLLDLLPDDPRAVAVARETRTLAELLTAPAPIGPGDRWQVPDLSDVTAVVQPHCHHHSVMTWTADRRLLTDAGAQFSALAGCCGLAGNFGMEKGHYDVSVAVAENALLPALRDAAPGRRLPGRRLLVPDPGRPAGRACRASTWPSCWRRTCRRGRRWTPRPERTRLGAHARRLLRRPARCG